MHGYIYTQLASSMVSRWVYMKLASSTVKDEVYMQLVSSMVSGWDFAPLYVCTALRSLTARTTQLTHAKTHTKQIRDACGGKKYKRMLI